MLVKDLRERPRPAHRVKYFILTRVPSAAG